MAIKILVVAEINIDFWKTQFLNPNSLSAALLDPNLRHRNSVPNLEQNKLKCLSLVLIFIIFFSVFDL